MNLIADISSSFSLNFSLSFFSLTWKDKNSVQNIPRQNSIKRHKTKNKKKAKKSINTHSFYLLCGVILFITWKNIVFFDSEPLWIIIIRVVNNSWRV